MRRDTNPNQISLFDAVEYRGVIERERERESRLRHIFNNIISIENLLIAWQEFLKGKRKRRDIAQFSLNLADHVLELHDNLSKKTYHHGKYFAFKINDPKPRDIHKAEVVDRLLHHAVYRILYPYFDNKFIYDSYSCRVDKGTHRAINRFREYGRKVSRNDTRTAWVLKCDIKKFFASINHQILFDTLEKHIDDPDVLWLLTEIVESFHAEKGQGNGLPLGNLTSQLLINVYMNEFDQFVKRKLKIKYYVRYADDFVILDREKGYLEELVPVLSEFLEKELMLTLHPKKLFIKTLASGVDFLGWVNFPKYRILKTSTKRRIFNKLKNNSKQESLVSYLGLLSHGNTYKLVRRIQTT